MAARKAKKITNPKDIEYDKQRSNYLNSKGYRVLRFWNSDVDSNIEGVYKTLKSEFKIYEW